MNFIEAIRSGFNNYFNFKGRASKSAFWYFLLFEFIYCSQNGTNGKNKFGTKPKK